MSLRHGQVIESNIYCEMLLRIHAKNYVDKKQNDFLC